MGSTTLERKGDNLMAVENKKEVVKTRVAKKKLVAKVIGLVDSTEENVLKYIEEGRELFFEDLQVYLRDTQVLLFVQ